jgi:aminoglycoside phosphotransferase (APT) family kinase protein
MMDPAVFAELRDLCLRSFPGRLGQRLSQVEPVETDRYSTLAFTLAWHEGTRPRVERLLVRRYVHDGTWWLSQDSEKAHREWVVMRWLYGYGFPLPEVYALGALERDPYLLMARPSGQAISALADGSERRDRTPGMRSSRQMDVSALGQRVEQLAELVARLHHLPPPESVRTVLPRADVKAVLAQATHIAQRFEDRALMESVRELDNIEMEAGPPCVLHGDPQLANCTYDARGITAWLNWENSALGDPRWDVACVANELEGAGASPLAERFCEVYAARTGLALHDVDYWQALSAVHRWAATRQALAIAIAGDGAPLSVRCSEFQQRAWRALARLRVTRTVPIEPET